MRAAIYIRVSTDEQANEGYSIAAQQSRLAAFCHSQEWDVYKIYIEEGRSAKDMERPELQLMLEEGKQGNFDVLLVYRLDRLTRSVLDLYTILKILDEHNLKFKSATEVYDTTTAMGRLFITLVAALAQWERETIAERIRFGMEQMVKEGKRPGAPKPYGYDSDGNIIEEEVAILQELRSLYIKGHGFFTIAQSLNRQTKYHRGAEWSQQYVKYCLDNPYYAGIIRWGRDGRGEEIEIKGDHLPIWTEEEYEAHTKRMKMRSGKNYTKTYQYWFTGILRCGRCGESLVGRLHKVQRVKAAEYIMFSYRCSGRNNGSGCKLPTLNQSLVEHLIFEYIERYKVDLERVGMLRKESVIDQKKRDREQEDLTKELDKIKERIKKWQRMCANELITEEELRSYLRDEREQEEKLKNKLIPFSTQPKTTPKRLLELPELWSKMDDQERHETCFSIFKKIVINAPDEKIPAIGKFRSAHIESIEYN